MCTIKQNGETYEAVGVDVLVVRGFANEDDLNIIKSHVPQETRLAASRGKK
jgi:hypothetical protein